jgi:hypothetical protein
MISGRKSYPIVNEFVIKHYTKDHQSEWNRFVAASKQGTFLFDRNYMDYHHDRFEDHSLMVYEGQKLVALLPANIAGDTLWSHQGLTYGGLLTSRKAKTAEVCAIFEALNTALRSEGIAHVVYKSMPWIYQQLPAEEDLYALIQVCGARIRERSVSSTLIMSHRLPFEESRKSGLRKALRNGLTVAESDRWADFWQILDDNLVFRHHTHPVHTLAEMQLLHGRFPDHIRLFMVQKDDRPLGGTVIFETPQVVHTQYISASPEGKATGALDLLFAHLFNEVYGDRPYFDFGVSTEQHGRVLNDHLIFQKEGFGGRAVCYDTYEWDL